MLSAPSTSPPFIFSRVQHSGSDSEVPRRSASSLIIDRGIDEERDVRAFSVEEGLLLVRTDILDPLAAGDGDPRLQGVLPPTGHQIPTELLAVGSPPQTTLAGQLEAVRAGRALAAQLARPMGCQAVALSPGLGPVTPQAHPAAHGPESPAPAGPTHGKHPTNGFRIHVDIESRIEAATVLERIGVWLPTLLALSANSPFWRGRDTGYASYRYQESLSWPATGRTDVIAQLSEGRPTVEICVADVCLDPTDAAAVATLARALVETAARSWRSDPPDVSASVLQAWCWPASRSGVEGQLIDPATGDPAPAGDVIARLLDAVRPVLSEYGEEESIETAVAEILRRGTGARRQRQAFAARRQMLDVVADALDATHAAPLTPVTAPPAATAHSDSFRSEPMTA